MYLSVSGKTYTAVTTSRSSRCASHHLASPHGPITTIDHTCMCVLVCWHLLLGVQIHVVSAADTFLPLIVADAMRPDLTPEEEEKAETEGKVRQKGTVSEGGGGIVNVDTVRWLRRTSSVRRFGVSSVLT